MRKSAQICYLICLMIMVAVHAQAQPRPPHRGSGEAPLEKRTPDQIAQSRTERMQQEIGLDEKQFMKIYNIYLKEERAKKQALEGNMMPPSGGFPGGGPGGFPGGGPPPQVGFPGMGHGGPPPGMPDEMSVPTVGGKAIDSDEYIEAREKKFRKILTTEQYSQFRAIHPDPTGFFMD